MAKTKPKPGRRGRPRRSRKMSLRLPWKRIVALLGVTGIFYVIWLDAQVRERFEGRRWQLPAQVFAAPAELYPGLRLTPDVLRQRLEALGYRSDARLDRPGYFRVEETSLEFHARSFQFAEGLQAAARYRVSFRGGQISAIESSGQRLDWIRLDPRRIGSILPGSGEDRILVPLQEVPADLIKLLLHTEDRNFYSHWGLSPTGIARAAWNNLRAGRVVQGGSTLTQQLVKNLYLSPDQTLLRKFNEAIMALLLELHYSKSEILEAYLNEVFLGQHGRRAIHGFGQGGHYYFGKSLRDLDLAENALLVALVKGASYYDPRRHSVRALERRDLVLDSALQAGLFAEAEVLAALNRPIEVVQAALGKANPYPAFLQLVRQQLGEGYPQEVLDTEGLRIYTTLDPQVQAQAEQVLAARMSQLTQAESSNQALQAAVVVTRQSDGEVLALLGGVNRTEVGFNRALEARRSIGSLIKPFTVAAAIEQGEATLASPLEDVAFQIRFENGTVWQPTNFDETEHGSVLLVDALARSYNLAMARLGLQVGIPAVVDVLREIGVREPINPYPALLLGALELSAYQVSQIYLNLVSGGFEQPQRAIRAVTDAQGNLQKRYRLNSRQVLTPETAYLVNFALSEAVRRGTGQGVLKKIPPDLRPAGKTGTSNDGRDAWFVGLDGERLVTVWFGRDDNQPTALTGASGPLPLVAELLQRLGPTSRELGPIAGIEVHWVDPVTGHLSGPGCPDAKALPFVAGTQPKQQAQCHEGLRLDQRLQQWWQEVF